MDRGYTYLIVFFGEVVHSVLDSVEFTISGKGDYNSDRSLNSMHEIGLENSKKSSDFGRVLFP